MKKNLGNTQEIIFQIRRAVSLLDKLSDQILETKLGIGFSQFLVMSVLAQQPKVPQKFVAKSLDQTQAAVSRQVDILVDLKLVSRQANNKNRREYILELSQLGKKRFNVGLKAINKLNQELTSVWTKQEHTVLNSAISKLIFEIKKG